MLMWVEEGGSFGPLEAEVLLADWGQIPVTFSCYFNSACTFATAYLTT